MREGEEGEVEWEGEEPRGNPLIRVLALGTSWNSQVYIL